MQLSGQPSNQCTYFPKPGFRVLDPSLTMWCIKLTTISSIAVKPSNQRTYFPHEQPLYFAYTQLRTTILAQLIQNRSNQGFNSVYYGSPILCLSWNRQLIGASFGLMDCGGHAFRPFYFYCSSFKVRLLENRESSSQRPTEGR